MPASGGGVFAIGMETSASGNFSSSSRGPLEVGHIDAFGASMKQERFRAMRDAGTPAIAEKSVPEIRSTQ
jgi:hypothetical protein